MIRIDVRVVTQRGIVTSCRSRENTEDDCGEGKRRYLFWLDHLTVHFGRGFHD